MQRLGLKLNKGMLNTQILDGIADMIRIVNSENEIVYFNDAMEDLFMGQSDKLWCSFDGSKDPDSFCDMTISQRCLATGQVIQREESIGEHYYSVKTNPIRGEDGEIIGAIEVFRNKSLEKKLQIELIEKNKSMTEEMNSAQNIQRALLPKRGYINRIMVDYFFIPADVLSGDIFDIYEFDKEHTAIYIADTVGHGFSSSMTTMFISQTMRNMPKSIQRDPAKTLNELSRRFKDLMLGIELYFTIFYAVYNRKTRELVYCNAGHNCPPLLKKNGKCIQPIELSGYPISRLFKDVHYENYKMSLKKGTEILFYTDGVIECRNRKQEEFGLEKLKALFLEKGEDFLESLIEEINLFVQGDYLDDMTCASVFIK